MPSMSKKAGAGCSKSSSALSKAVATALGRIPSGCVEDLKTRGKTAASWLVTSSDCALLLMLMTLAQFFSKQSHHAQHREISAIIRGKTQLAKIAGRTDG